MKQLILAFLTVAFLSGCALLETVETSPTAAKLTVQQATIRVIGTDMDRAARVLEIAAQTRGMIEVDAVTVSLVDEFIRVQVDWSKLDLPDAQLLAMLLDELRDRLAEKLGDGLISPEDKVSISKVIDWVEDSARLTQAYYGG